MVLVVLVASGVASGETSGVTSGVTSGAAGAGDAGGVNIGGVGSCGCLRAVQEVFGVFF